MTIEEQITELQAARAALVATQVTTQTAIELIDMCVRRLNDHQVRMLPLVTNVPVRALLSQLAALQSRFDN